MPAVIGRQGVLSTIAVPLDGEEREALELSAQKIKEVIESISGIESMEGNNPGYYGA
jgi:malate/lactate dehydrogenase